LFYGIELGGKFAATRADEAAHKPQRTAALLQGMAFCLSIVIR
jgi:hypothetical protein